MLRLNLLPWRPRVRARRKRIFLGQLAGVAVAAASLGVAAGVGLDRQLADQQLRNGFLARAIAQLDARIAAMDVLRRDHQALLEREQALARLWTGRTDTARILDDVAQTLAPDLHFVALKKDGRTLVGHGVAASNDRVAALMRNIGESTWLDAPVLKSIGDAGDALYGDHAAAFEIAFETSGLGSPPRQANKDGA